MRKLDYLNHKKLHLIQKARLPLQIRIQMIHNNAVDEKILEYYDDVNYKREGGTPAYNEQVLTSEIGALNRVATQQDFNRLLSNSLITPDDITRLQASNKARGLADRITKVEVERTLKNLDHITNEILPSVDVNIQEYKNLVKKVPRQVSRLDILEKALAKGENFKGKKYGVKELDRLSRDLEKYKAHNSELDTALLENEQARREGFEPLKSKKVWVWSQLERTRHLGMEGQEVGLYDKFTVVNDLNGDTDYLRFPGDIDGDMHGCSNICNCACSYVIE